MNLRDSTVLLQSLHKIHPLIAIFTRLSWLSASYCQDSIELLPERGQCFVGNLPLNSVLSQQVLTELSCGHIYHAYIYIILYNYIYIHHIWCNHVHLVFTKTAKSIIQYHHVPPESWIRVKFKAVRRRWNCCLRLERLCLTRTTLFELKPMWRLGTTWHHVVHVVLCNVWEWFQKAPNDSP